MSTEGGRAVVRSVALGVFAVICVAGFTWAQHEHASSPSPYAGQETREIKALSGEEMAQYLAGEGMGFALAAELNHYPGPRHVLDLAATLELSAEQLAAVRRIRDAMQADARRLGVWIVARERRLDRAFASGTIDEATLRARTEEIARLQGELRYVHLRAHLAVQRLLAEGQVRRYDTARGYGGAAR
jgi:Spy/CpxP family protein refolding chaperone